MVLDAFEGSDGRYRVYKTVSRLQPKDFAVHKNTDSLHFLFLYIEMLLTDFLSLQLIQSCLSEAFSLFLFVGQPGLANPACSLWKIMKSTGLLTLEPYQKISCVLLVKQGPSQALLPMTYSSVCLGIPALSRLLFNGCGKSGRGSYK